MKKEDLVLVRKLVVCACLAVATVAIWVQPAAAADSCTRDCATTANACYEACDTDRQACSAEGGDPYLCQDAWNHCAAFCQANHYDCLYGCLNWR